MKTQAYEHDDAAARHVRLVVRVLQGLVRAETFSSYGDLAEALKTRCAALRIAYDAGVISQAIDRVELGGRQRIVPLPMQPRRQLVERPIAPDPIDKAAAASILDAIGARLT
jgi:hypothetical protein